MYYHLKLSELEKLEESIAPTKKTVLNSDKLVFGEDEDTVSWDTTDYFLTEVAREDFGKIYGFPAKYAAKAPWPLFKTVFSYLLDEAEDGKTQILVEYVKSSESGNLSIVNLQNYEKSQLTLDDLISNYLGNLDEEFTLRWLDIKGDTVFLDVEFPQEFRTVNHGIRLVIDLSLKTGIKMFKLLNVSEEFEEYEGEQELCWRPVIVSEAEKVGIKGLESSEIYAALVTKVEYFATSPLEIEAVENHVVYATNSSYGFDEHVYLAVANLAIARPNSVSAKLVKDIFDNLAESNLSALDFVNTYWGMIDVTAYKPDAVHKAQVFFGNVLRYHEEYIAECNFCDIEFEVSQ